MTSKTSEKLLPPQLLKLRPESKLQKDLARQIEVSASFVCQAESGEAVPSDERLAAWARVLKREKAIPHLLLCAAHDRIADGHEAATLRESYRRMIRTLQQVEPEAVEAATTRTLGAFPTAFQPLVVVTGDKREDPPKSEGDVGALSASPLDDRYLRDITLPRGTDKISDKVFVQLELADLRKAFGKVNLFVIGSPASNHLARMVNRHALFRFAFNQKTADEIDRITDAARTEKVKGPGALKVLRDNAVRDLKFIMYEFKQGGIFDPLPDKLKLRGRALREAIDFATITVARNPFAEDDDYVAVMAAGFHLPGTVHAVKMLSQPDRFGQHPFGGVVEVRMNADAPWHEKIQRAEAQFETEPYTIEQIQRALATTIVDHPYWPGTPNEAAELSVLVQSLANPRSAHSGR